MSPIDPGRPFARPFLSLVEALENGLRNGVERPETFSFVFQHAVASYPLPATLFSLVRVSGLVNSRFFVFTENVHYRFAANRLTWIDGAPKPDNGKRVDVEYTVREQPSGITDFNQGSVAGTLVRALSREMAQLYAQMDEAYRRAFIDFANDVALDNVVALLGVQRTPAQAAIGEVTFFRKTPSPQPLVIPIDTRVADQAGRTFVTTAEGTIPSPTPFEEVLAPAGRAVKVTRPIAELRGVWPVAANPDTSVPLAAGAAFGADARTITLNADPPPGDLRVRYVPRAATVPVRAVEPGPEGNVNAGTITVMPTPPAQVDGVTNELPTVGGQAAESDDRLRERAKHALERAGNATINAIKFSVLGVDGVEGVEVIDHSVDDDVPLGEVRVRYSGGRIEEVRQAVESSRAAGVIARLEEIQDVLISGTFNLVDVAGGASAASLQEFLARVRDLIKAQGIGVPLSVRRLSAIAFEIPGLGEVVEAQLRFRRVADNSTGDVTDPFIIAPTEIVQPDGANLRAVVLDKLRLAGSAPLPEPDRLTLSIQVLDTAGSAVTFRRLSLDATVGIRAYSRTAPDAPPERIGSVGKVLEYEASNTAAITITNADLAGFRAADHNNNVEFVIEAPAYPALDGVTSRIPI
jgi:uncharacterized phage protein gp47/JayE